MKTFTVIGPDELPITQEPFLSFIDAHAGITAFVARYEKQGYYSNVRQERIPLMELHKLCTIVEDDSIEEQVANRVKELGFDASYEFPGTVEINMPEGHGSEGCRWCFGTVNPEWGGNYLDQDGDAVDNAGYEVLSAAGKPISSGCINVEMIARGIIAAMYQNGYPGAPESTL